MWNIITKIRPLLPDELSLSVDLHWGKTRKFPSAPSLQIHKLIYDAKVFPIQQNVHVVGGIRPLNQLLIQSLKWARLVDRGSWIVDRQSQARCANRLSAIQGHKKQGQTDSQHDPISSQGDTFNCPELVHMVHKDASSITPFISTFLHLFECWGELWLTSRCGDFDKALLLPNLFRCFCRWTITIYFVFPDIKIFVNPSLQWPLLDFKIIIQNFTFPLGKQKQILMHSTKKKKNNESWLRRRRKNIFWG